jgi:hypothetical protein
MSQWRLSWLGLLAGLAGCQPVVDAEFKDVEVTKANNTVPPAPAAAIPSVTFSFLLNSSSFGATTDPNAQDTISKVLLRRLQMTASSGIADLSFLQTLHAVAYVPIDKTSANQFTTARQVEIADYEREFDLPPSATFDVPIPEPVDLLPLLRPSPGEPRQVRVVVNLGGKLPTATWTVDVSMGLSIEIRQ